VRRVTVTFDDGSSREYETIKQAAEDLRVCKTAMTKMACGESMRTMYKLHISSVSLSGNRYVKHIRKVGGSSLPLKCTNEDGTVIHAKSIREAVKLTGFTHVMHFLIDDGHYHWGWRFDSEPRRDPDAVEYGDMQVPDEVIDTLYRFAHYYLIRYGGMPREEREDIIQHVVNHVAAEYSNGEHLKRGATYTLNAWLYLRTRHYGSKKAHKWIKESEMRVEKPESLDMDRDTWLDNLTPSKDSQTDEDYIRTLPEKYRKLARLLLEGRNGTERTSMMHMTSMERISLERELGEWLKHKAHNHDCSSSDL